MLAVSFHHLVSICACINVSEMFYQTASWMIIFTSDIYNFYQLVYFCLFLQNKPTYTRRWMGDEICSIFAPAVNWTFGECVCITNKQNEKCGRPENTLRYCSELLLLEYKVKTQMQTRQQMQSKKTFIYVFYISLLSSEGIYFLLHSIT